MNTKIAQKTLRLAALAALVGSLVTLAGCSNALSNTGAVSPSAHGSKFGAYPIDEMPAATASGVRNTGRLSTRGYGFIGG